MVALQAVKLSARRPSLLAMPERRPAFQCYASDDVLANGDVAELSHEAFGLFFRLYCRAWNEEGLPNDPDRLARWARISREQWDSLWAEMAHLWAVDGDGRWRNSGQEAKRQKVIAYVESRSENGRKGGRPKGSTKKPREKHMVSDEKHVKSNGKAKESSSSSFSSSSSTSEELQNSPPDGAPAALDAGQNLLGWWIKREEKATGSRPPDSEIGKQSRAARQICEERKPEQINRAIEGMPRLFKYSRGQPWDLLDLRREFQAALTAPPDTGQANGNGRNGTGRGDRDAWRYRAPGVSIADGDPTIIPDDY